MVAGVRFYNKEKIEDVLITAAQTGLPIYALPGNHEHKKDWKEVISKISKKYLNIIDLSKIRIVDGDDFDFISNPYGSDFTYSNKSFKGTPAQIRKIGEYAKQLQKDDDPEILLTHQPPKCKGKYGIDVIFNGKNVGDKTLDETMRKSGIRFSLSGHIHEAGGKGVTSIGELVKQNTFSDDLRFNPGSAAPWEYLNGKFYNGMAGIFTIEGDKSEV